MKLKLTKTLIFACIFLSALSGFAQTFDRDNRRNSSTEEVTNTIDSPRSNGITQFGTNFSLLSNIGKNLELSMFIPLSKPNENGQQSIFLGTTISSAYGDQSLFSILSVSGDLTLNYKIPIPNAENLSIFIGAGTGYYYTSFLDSGTTYGGYTPESVGQFAAVFKGSINYFFSNTIGLFGTLSKAGSGDITVSAGLVFRRAR